MRNKHLLYEFNERKLFAHNNPFWVENKMGKIQYVFYSKKIKKKEYVGFNIMAFLPETNEYIELDISRLTRIMFDNSYKIIRPTWETRRRIMLLFSIASDGDIIRAKWVATSHKLFVRQLFSM